MYAGPLSGPRVAALVVAALLGCAGVSRSSELWVAHAYQPFDMPDGIALSPVTYVGYGYGTSGEEFMTVLPNRIWHETPDYRHKGIVSQENMAFSAGLRLARGMDTGLTWKGDTTTVVVDARALARKGFEGEWPDTTLIDAVAECLKANAGQHWPAVAYLAVRFVGSERYTKFGGVFDLKAYKCGPITRYYASKTMDQTRSTK